MSQQISTILPDVHLTDCHAKTTSINIAKVFNKPHDKVVRDIRNMEIPEQFSLANFGESEYKNSRGKMYPMYEITRDGFALLAMGFTGAKAMAWKINYIQLFNALEAQAIASKDARMLEMQEQLLIRQDQLIDTMMKLQIKGTLVTPDERSYIRSLFARGLNKTEIGRRTGRGRDTVRRILRSDVPNVH